MNHSQLKALLPNGPLSITDEIIHKDLNDWSKELLEELDGELHSKDSNQLNICAYLNQAALITSVQGKVDAARDLCQLQIGWIKEKMTQQGLTIDSLFSILQPWINLGRLNHIEKRYVHAIPHFDMAEKVFEGKSIQLDGLEIRHKEVTGFLKDSQRGELLDKYLIMNHIDGLIKIYISSSNYLEGLSFVEEQQNRKNTKLDFLLEECELMLLLKMGKFDQALVRSQQIKPKSPFKKLILLYYTTLVSLLTNQGESARKYGIKLANYLVKATKEESFIGLKKLLLMTAKLCKEIGLGQSAYNLNQVGLTLSLKLNDQRYCISFGLGLYESNMISDKEKHDILSELEFDLARSHYKIREADSFGVSHKAKPEGDLQRLQQYIYLNFGEQVALRNSSPKLAW